MNSNFKNENLKKTVITAMFAAMAAVLTAFVQIKTPTGGYIHLGDCAVYLAACFLPLPYAMAAGAIGGGLADLLVYPETILYTVIIKALNASVFSSKGDKIATKRNLAMAFVSGLITVVGYSISKYIRVMLAGGTSAAALADAIRKIPENSIQAAASAAIFIIAALAFDKLDLKKKLLK